MNGFDEEDDLNIAQDTSADILNKGREASSDALANSSFVDGDGEPSVFPSGETNEWGGNLRNEGRKVMLRRDKNGKVSGYSTTTSMTTKDDDGSFVVIPTVVDGRELSPEDAVSHYRKTGEYWGKANDEDSAREIARKVHERHQSGYQRKWNDYIHSHWDDMSDDIRNDAGIAEEHARRVGGNSDMSNVAQNQPSFTRDEMLDRFANGGGYTEEEVDSMTDDQYRDFIKTSEEYFAAHPTMKMRRAKAQKNKEKWDYADSLAKMADYVVQQTEDDPDFANDYSEAKKYSEILKQYGRNFGNLSAEDQIAFAENIGKMYEDAKNRRGLVEKMADSFARGHESLAAFIYRGAKLLQPNELDESDMQTLEGSRRTQELADIMHPKQSGSYKDNKDIGDWIDYIAENAAENVERIAVGAAASTAGAILAPYVGVSAGVGAIAGGTAGTLLLNGGEAVSDQLDEAASDKNINFSRGHALAQTGWYSILDGALGVDKFFGKVFSKAVKNLGMGVIKEGVEKWAEETAKSATLKGFLKNYGKNILEEAIQEPAQSQIGGRGRRYLQTGSALTADELEAKRSGRDSNPVLTATIDEGLGGAGAAAILGFFGGAANSINANRVVRLYDNMLKELKRETNYNSFSTKERLLITQRLANDALLETSGIFKEGAKEKIQKMSDEINSALSSQGRAYVDMFKQQFSALPMDEALAAASAAGIKTRFNTDSMNGQQEELSIGVDGGETRTLTSPETGIRVSRHVNAEGKVSYVVENVPNMKSPFANCVFDTGDEKTDFENAVKYASELDVYNQYRAKQQEDKRKAIDRVYKNMYGERSPELVFVDRPNVAERKLLPVGHKAAYDLNGNRVLVDADAVDTLGSLYTLLGHERSHADIAEGFAKESFAPGGPTAEQIGKVKEGRQKYFGKDKAGKEQIKGSEKTTNLNRQVSAFEVNDIYNKAVDANGNFSLGKFRMEFEKLFDLDGVSDKNLRKFADMLGSGKNDAQSIRDGLTALYINNEKRRKMIGTESGSPDVVRKGNDWGEDIARTGEEMVVERMSINDLYNALSSSSRGLLSEGAARLAKAIGIKMAFDMGVDPSLITSADVQKELGHILRSGYAGKTSKYERPGTITSNEDAAPEEIANKTVESEDAPAATPVVPAETTAVETAPVAPEGGTYLEPMVDGEGENIPVGTVIQRKDGRMFTKSDNGWITDFEDKKVTTSDSDATDGGWRYVTKGNSVPKDSAAPTETKINKNSAQVDKKAPEKPIEKAIRAENTAQTAQNTKAAEPKTTAKESLAVSKAEAPAPISDDFVPHGMKTKVGLIKEDVAGRIFNIDQNIKIVGIDVHGSRIRGDNRADSDLDVVVEFDGDWSESALFDALHKEPFEIDGVKIDINPITKGKSGSLKEYMARSSKPTENAPQSAPSEKGVTSWSKPAKASRAAPVASEAKTEEKSAEKPAPKTEKDSLFDSMVESAESKKPAKKGETKYDKARKIPRLPRNAKGRRLYPADPAELLNQYEKLLNHPDHTASTLREAIDTVNSDWGRKVTYKKVTDEHNARLAKIIETANDRVSKLEDQQREERGQRNADRAHNRQSVMSVEEERDMLKWYRGYMADKAAWIKAFIQGDRWKGIMQEPPVTYRFKPGTYYAYPVWGYRTVEDGTVREHELEEKFPAGEFFEVELWDRNYKDNKKGDVKGIKFRDGADLNAYHMLFGKTTRESTATEPVRDQSKVSLSFHGAFGEDKLADSGMEFDDRVNGSDITTAEIFDQLVDQYYEMRDLWDEHQRGDGEEAWAAEMEASREAERAANPETEYNDQRIAEDDEAMKALYGDEEFGTMADDILLTAYEIFGDPDIMNKSEGEIIAGGVRNNIPEVYKSYSDTKLMRMAYDHDPNAFGLLYHRFMVNTKDNGGGLPHKFAILGVPEGRIDDLCGKVWDRFLSNSMYRKSDSAYHKYNANTMILGMADFIYKDYKRLENGLANRKGGETLNLDEAVEDDSGDKMNRMDAISQEAVDEIDALNGRVNRYNEYRAAADKVANILEYLSDGRAKMLRALLAADSGIGEEAETVADTEHTDDFGNLESLKKLNSREKRYSTRTLAKAASIAGMPPYLYIHELGDLFKEIKAAHTGKDREGKRIALMVEPEVEAAYTNNELSDFMEDDKKGMWAFMTRLADERLDNATIAKRWNDTLKEDGDSVGANTVRGVLSKAKLLYGWVDPRPSEGSKYQQQLGLDTEGQTSSREILDFAKMKLRTGLSEKKVTDIVQGRFGLGKLEAANEVSKAKSAISRKTKSGVSQGDLFAAAGIAEEKAEAAKKVPFRELTNFIRDRIEKAEDGFVEIVNAVKDKYGVTDSLATERVERELRKANARMEKERAKKERARSTRMMEVPGPTSSTVKYGKAEQVDEVKQKTFDDMVADVREMMSEGISEQDIVSTVMNDYGETEAIAKMVVARVRGESEDAAKVVGGSEKIGDGVKYHFFSEEFTARDELVSRLGEGEVERLDKVWKDEQARKSAMRKVGALMSFWNMDAAKLSSLLSRRGLSEEKIAKTVNGKDFVQLVNAADGLGLTKEEIAKTIDNGNSEKVVSELMGQGFTEIEAREMVASFLSDVGNSEEEQKIVSNFSAKAFSGSRKDKRVIAEMMERHGAAETESYTSKSTTKRKRGSRESVLATTQKELFGDLFSFKSENAAGGNENIRYKTTDEVLAMSDDEKRKDGVLPSPSGMRRYVLDVDGKWGVWRGIIVPETEEGRKKLDRDKAGEIGIWAKSLRDAIHIAKTNYIYDNSPFAYDRDKGDFTIEEKKAYNDISWRPVWIHGYTSDRPGGVAYWYPGKNEAKAQRKNYAVIIDEVERKIDAVQKREFENARRKNQGSAGENDSSGGTGGRSGLGYGARGGRGVGASVPGVGGGVRPDIGAGSGAAVIPPGEAGRVAKAGTAVQRDLFDPFYDRSVSLKTIIGENGAIDDKNLPIAKQMLGGRKWHTLSHDEKRHIVDATGWQLNAKDGKWRKVGPGFDLEKTNRLGEVFDAVEDLRKKQKSTGREVDEFALNQRITEEFRKAIPEELLKMYPKLRELKFRIVDSIPYKGSNSVAAGGFDNRRFMIMFDKRFSPNGKEKNPQELFRVIFEHEVQHAIQNIEGFFGASRFAKPDNAVGLEMEREAHNTPYAEDGELLEDTEMPSDTITSRGYPKPEREMDIRYKTSGLYTGSAADYDAPSLLKVGTGEGAQVYGWGLYASNQRGVAENYAIQESGKRRWVKEDNIKRSMSSISRTMDYLERRIESTPYAESKSLRDQYTEANNRYNELNRQLEALPRANVYEQTFFTNRAPGDESHLLNWYEPVSEENARRAIDAVKSLGLDQRDLDATFGGDWENKLREATGQKVYQMVTDAFANLDVDNAEESASELLAKFDIDGIKYPVDSYGKGVKNGDEAGWNYVSFRDDNITVDHKWVDGTQMFKTSDPAYIAADSADAVFANRESQESKGLYWGKDIVRPSVKDRELERIAQEANDVLGAKEAVVEKALGGEGLNEREMRQLVLIERDALNRLNNVGSGMNTDNAKSRSEEYDLAQKGLDRISLAVQRAISHAGATLREAQKAAWFDTTRDQLAYLERHVRATMAKQGVSGEIPEAVRKMLDEQAKALEDANREVARAQAELAKANEEAKMLSRDLEIERARGGKPFRMSGDAREKLASLSKKYGFSVTANTMNAIGALARLGGVSNIRTAGPGEGTVISLTDEMRECFGQILADADGDFDKALGLIHGTMDNRFDSAFAQYRAEMEKTPSPDGTKSGKRRVIREKAKKQSEDFVQKNYPALDVGRIAPSGKNLDAMKRKVERERAEAIEMLGDFFANDEMKREVVGNYLRDFMRYYALENPSKTNDEVLQAMLDEANAIDPEHEYRPAEMADVLLGDNGYTSRTRERVSARMANLQKALSLAKSGDLKGAAEAAGISYRSDTDLILELDNKLRGKINRALDSLDRAMADSASGAGEDAVNTLRENVNEMVNALRDIHSGGDVGEMLDKYLHLIESMRNAKRESTILDTINRHIAEFNRRLAENDFEPKAKRVKPNVESYSKAVRRKMEERDKLRKRFEAARASYEYRKRSSVARLTSDIFEILGEVKSIAGALDFSSVLRQGGQLTWAHPLLFAKNFRKMLSVFLNEDKAQAAMDEIRSRPNAKYYEAAGVDFTDWGRDAVNKDDRFLLNQYRRITRWKPLRVSVEASERAFSMYLNLMRADVFDHLVAASTYGDASKMPQKALEAIGDFINIGSQRGAFHSHSEFEEKVKSSVPFLNSFLWSPRNVISRFQFLWQTAKLAMPWANPYGDKALRGLFAKELLRYFGGVAVAIKFAKFISDLIRGDDEPPEDLVLDPRSSEFLKVKFGNTRVDFLSGLAQSIVFSVRMAPKWIGGGMTVNARGEARPTDHTAVLGRFLRSKFSPAMGIIWDMGTGSTFDKQEITYSNPFAYNKDEAGIVSYIAGQIFPLTLSDLWEQASQSGLSNAAITSIGTILGLGTNTYNYNTYNNLSADYKFYKRLYVNAESQDEKDRLLKYYPMLKMAGSIEAQIKRVNKIKSDIKKLQKVGGDTSVLDDMLEREKKIAINMIMGFNHPGQTD